MLRRLMLVAVYCGIAVSSSAQAVQPTVDEMDAARRWVGAKFDNTPDDQKPAAQSGLVVVANYDPVQKNARAGKPMNLAGNPFTRGLYCHATSKLIVRLPSPGKSFSAIVGVDSNDQTSGGRGSVVFSVDVGGKTALRSELVREGMPCVGIIVDLAGATEFVLAVGDGGDGFACDQADWADAKVILADGKTVWLGDLPLIETPPPAFTTEPPFSFTYGGRPSAELLAAWPCQRSTRKLDAERTEHVATWTDPKTGLEVRCVAVAYGDFPTIEWTLYFKNSGTADTPILENIQGLDAVFDGGGKGEYTLDHYRGSPCLPTDYEPFETPLGAGATKRIAAAGGRPTNSDLPYFNVAWPGQGVILTVGWPGQWAAEFARDSATGLHVRAGQELTHLKLHPGEEIRSPLMAVQFYRGDRIRSQNVWRRWMLAHNLPRPGGKLPPSHLAACSSHQFGEMINADSASQKLFVDRYLEEGLKLDYWWMDAGWYQCDGQWPKVGTWEVDQKRFPGGLRPICDHAHAKGVKSIVWFEPERVTERTWLFEKHPEWLLGSGSTRLLNLGNADAREWLTDHVDRLLTEQGIDLYRQDFNMDPLGFWRANDAEDRQGITENGHVVGYLAYWDELRRRHPNMLIDSCASGGRRNDLETLRRAVPLLRSDYIMDAIANQGHTYGISFWMPFFGTGTGSRTNTPYDLRSALCPAFTACFDVRRTDLDYEMLRRVVNGWRSYSPYFFGDYYPLTAYSLDPKVWIAWQFDCPERGEGMVQVFRRPESVYESARFTLSGLEPDARYVLADLDGGQKFEAATGRELAERGVVIAVPERPGAVVVTYKRIE